MAENTVEILSPYPSGVIHRMKLEPLIRQKPGGLDFCPVGEGNEHTSALLVNGLSVDLDKAPSLVDLLQKRAQHALVMLFIPDLSEKLLPSLHKWLKFVDVFLVPTPEMKQLTQLFTERSVEVLLDPIDFGFSESFADPVERVGPLRIVWFGFPDSYKKSMTAHEGVLNRMHLKKEIEYHIVTRHGNAEEVPQCVLHHYIPETFPALLQSFDACVLSHVPVDFDVNTSCKLENKAVLAINRGVPVIASRTPAYERLLTACGLGEYLFTSNDQLKELIAKLRSREERSSYLRRSQELVLTRYSSQVMVRDWLDIYERGRQVKFGPEKGELLAMAGN